MVCFKLGSISFWISSVSIFKCFIGIGWVVRGTEEELNEYKIFKDEFSPFLIKQNNEMEITEFCKIKTLKIDEIPQKYNLKSSLIEKFSQRIKNNLIFSRNQSMTIQYTDKYSKWVAEWIKSFFGKIAQ